MSTPGVALHALDELGVGRSTSPHPGGRVDQPLVAAIGDIAVEARDRLPHAMLAPGNGGTYFSSGFRIFTSSAWTNSLPQIRLPVLSGSSSPAMPLTVPPASRTMICPAAMSHGCRLRSQ
jgi:hypothetical protein